MTIAPDLDCQVPALVLRCNRDIFPYGTLGVIRSLGRAGVEVHCVLEGPHASAAWSRHLHCAHPWLPAPSEPAALLAGLASLADRIGRPAVLIAVDDPGAIFIAEHGAELASMFLLPRPDPLLPLSLADKADLAAICGRLGIPQPATEVPSSMTDVAAAVARLGLPLMAKWSRPWLLPHDAGLSSTTVVQTAAEAAELFAAAQWAGSRLVLQRHIPVTPTGDWFFHGYFDQNSACLYGGTGRKLRDYPPDAGITTLGRWLPNRHVYDAAVRLAADIGYRGLLDLDFRYDALAGTYQLLDFNPRLGAQFRLFSDAGGLDVVRAMHLDLTGRSVPPARPRYGRGFVVENYDALSVIRRRLQGRRSPTGWLRPLRGVGESAWFAFDDPAPFAAMSVRWLALGLRRLRQSRSRPAGRGRVPALAQPDPRR